VAGFGLARIFPATWAWRVWAKCAPWASARNMLISVFLLPAWWRFFRPQSHSPQSKVECRNGSERKARRAKLPAFLSRRHVALRRLARANAAGGIGERNRPAARRIGIGGSNGNAAKSSCKIFCRFFPATNQRRKKAGARRAQEFRLELIDLWRVGKRVKSFAIGSPPRASWKSSTPRGAAGRGTLFITLHLGNWGAWRHVAHPTRASG